MWRCAASSSSPRRSRAPGTMGVPTNSPRSTGSARPISNSPAPSRRIYSAMFEAGVAVGSNPALREASERAFAVLRGAADKICAAMPSGARPPALMVALHIWAMAHGVASLFGRGDGAQRALPMSPAELLEAHMLVYLRGLGVYAGREGPCHTRECGYPERCCGGGLAPPHSRGTGPPVRRRRTWDREAGRT